MRPKSKNSCDNTKTATSIKQFVCSTSVFWGLVEKIFWTIGSPNRLFFFCPTFRRFDSHPGPSTNAAPCCCVTCLAPSAALSRRQPQSRPANSTTCMRDLCCPACVQRFRQGVVICDSKTAAGVNFYLELNRAASSSCRGAASPNCNISNP